MTAFRMFPMAPVITWGQMIPCKKKQHKVVSMLIYIFHYEIWHLRFLNGTWFWRYLPCSWYIKAAYRGKQENSTSDWWSGRKSVLLLLGIQDVNSQAEQAWRSSRTAERDWKQTVNKIWTFNCGTNTELCLMSSHKDERFLLLSPAAEVRFRSQVYWIHLSVQIFACTLSWFEEWMSRFEPSWVKKSIQQPPRLNVFVFSGY